MQPLSTAVVVPGGSRSQLPPPPPPPPKPLRPSPTYSVKSAMTEREYLRSTKSRNRSVAQSEYTSRVAQDISASNHHISSLDRHSIHSWSPVPKARPKASLLVSSSPTRAHSFNVPKDKRKKLCSQQVSCPQLQSLPSLSAYLNVTKGEEVHNDCTTEASICHVTENSGSEHGRSAYGRVKSRTEERCRSNQSVASTIVVSKQRRNLRPWPTNPQRSVKMATLCLELPDEGLEDLPMSDREITRKPPISTITTTAVPCKVGKSIHDTSGYSTPQRCVSNNIPIPISHSVVDPKKHHIDILSDAMSVTDTSLQDSFPLIDWSSNDDDEGDDDCFKSFPREQSFPATSCALPPTLVRSPSASQAA